MASSEEGEARRGAEVLGIEREKHGVGRWLTSSHLVQPPGTGGGASETPNSRALARKQGGGRASVAVSRAHRTEQQCGGGDPVRKLQFTSFSRELVAAQPYREQPGRAITVLCVVSSSTFLLLADGRRDLVDPA